MGESKWCSYNHDVIDDKAIPIKINGLYKMNLGLYYGENFQNIWKKEKKRNLWLFSFWSIKQLNSRTYLFSCAPNTRVLRTYSLHIRLSIVLSVARVKIHSFLFFFFNLQCFRTRRWLLKQSSLINARAHHANGVARCHWEQTHKQAFSEPQWCSIQPVKQDACGGRG